MTMLCGMMGTEFSSREMMSFRSEGHWDWTVANVCSQFWEICLGGSEFSGSNEINIQPYRLEAVSSLISFTISKLANEKLQRAQLDPNDIPTTCQSCVAKFGKFHRAALNSWTQ